MKRKSLMTMAIASAFGLSAAAFAGSNHEVITPFSVSDAGENVFAHKEGFSKSYHHSAMGSTSHDSSVSLSGSYSDSSALLGSESTASISMDESLAMGDAGIYSDFYVVSYTPVMESWDLYVIDTGEPGELAAVGDSEIGMPTHELALLSSDEGASWELALVPTDELSSEGTG